MWALSKHQVVFPLTSQAQANVPSSYYSPKLEMTCSHRVTSPLFSQEPVTFLGTWTWELNVWVPWGFSQVPSDNCYLKDQSTAFQWKMRFSRQWGIKTNEGNTYICFKSTKYSRKRLNSSWMQIFCEYLVFTHCFLRSLFQCLLSQHFWRTLGVPWSYPTTISPSYSESVGLGAQWSPSETS